MIIPSDLDFGQCIQGAFDQTTGRLRVDANISSSIIAPPGLEVAIEDTDDSIKIGNGSGIYAQVTGTNALKTDSSAVTQPISAVSLPLPSGAATDSELVTINTTLGSPFQVGGSISNTTFASTQSGVWNINNILGTISLPTGASTSSLQTTGNTSLNSIDNKTPSLGQAVMSASSPVVISSNQSTLSVKIPDVTNLSQTINALNQTVTISTVGMGSLILSYFGGANATIAFEATLDGTNWFGWVGMSNSTLNATSSTTLGVDDTWLFPTMAIQAFRVRCSVYISGSETISLAVSQAFGGQVIPFTQYPSTAGAFPVTLVNTNTVTDSAVITQASTTSGQSGYLGMTATTTSTPTYVTAKSNPLNTNTAGGLRSDIAQIAGATTLTGNGVTGIGSIRVTIASDTTSNTNVWNDNIKQINGVTPLMGNGVTGTGSQRVTIASDNTAFTVNSAQSGAWNITNVSGTISLPTGASTSANQTTQIASLSSIDGKLASLGQKNMAGSEPVVIASDQTAFNVNAIPVDSSNSTYAGSITGVVPTTGATDVFTLTGSGTKTIKITRIVVSGIAASLTTFDVSLIIRSTANTAGTSSSITAVPYDSNNVAATATCLAYTANPTLGTSVGSIGGIKITFLTATSAATPTIISWADRPAQAPTLRGINQVFAINFNGSSIVAGNVDFTIEWTEQ